MIALQRWATYWLMTAALTAAVLFKGGVHPQQWLGSALGISVAAVLVGTTGAGNRTKLCSSDKWGLGMMGLLLAWMLFQLVPLPPALVKQLTPEHWHAIAAARAVTGQDPEAWASLSVAPSATFERLLNVIPAMAVFVVTREMACWWQDRIWIAVAPVVGVALFESVLGLAQFHFMRAAGGEAGSTAGTYVNRNHFAGLLEMAFPVAVALAVSAGRKCAAQFDQTAGRALRMALMLAVPAALLAGVVVSQSRMGFIAIFAGAGVTILIVGLSLSPMWQDERDQTGRERPKAWQWGLALALPVAIALLLPTRELILRFGDMASTEEVSRNDRVRIWHDTLQFIKAYKWAGSGLGAYEHGFFRYQTVAPLNTVDFAHNDYLQMQAEMGIPGSLLVGALAGWIVTRALVVVLWRRDVRNWELAVGLFASLVTLGVHSMADFNLYIPANALVLAWLGGIAASPGLRRP